MYRAPDARGVQLWTAHVQLEQKQAGGCRCDQRHSRATAAAFAFGVLATYAFQVATDGAAKGVVQPDPEGFHRPAAQSCHLQPHCLISGASCGLGNVAAITVCMDEQSNPVPHLSLIHI